VLFYGLTHLTNLTTVAECIYKRDARGSSFIMFMSSNRSFSVVGGGVDNALEEATLFKMVCVGKISTLVGDVAIGTYK
jgi:hypothetical protein